MKSASRPTLSPPWASVSVWQEANVSVDFHVERHYSRLKAAVQTARETRLLLESIFPSLDDLCMMTCPRCPDACCLSASPWYDLRDLIFLHLNRLSIPRSQTISKVKDTCRFLGRRGCTLARITRPWICTWYLCPTQTSNAKDRDLDRWITVNKALGEIQTNRKQLEIEFIRAVAG